MLRRDPGPHHRCQAFAGIDVAHVLERSAAFVIEGGPGFDEGRVVGRHIGEMPVKAAARYPHCFRQRLGFQGRETALSQRLEALIEPVLGGKLTGHFPNPEAPYHTPLY